YLNHLEAGTTLIKVISFSDQQLDTEYAHAILCLLDAGYMGKEFDEPLEVSLPGEVSVDNPYSTARISETAYRLNVLSLLVSERTVNEYLGAHNELSDIEHAMTQAQETLLTQE